MRFKDRVYVLKEEVSLLHTMRLFKLFKAFIRHEALLDILDNDKDPYGSLDNDGKSPSY